jgi:hypothetical protein
MYLDLIAPTVKVGTFHVQITNAMHMEEDICMDRNTGIRSKEWQIKIMSNMNGKFYTCSSNQPHFKQHYDGY